MYFKHQIIIPKMPFKVYKNKMRHSVPIVYVLGAVGTLSTVQKMIKMGTFCSLLSAKLPRSYSFKVLIDPHAKFHEQVCDESLSIFINVECRNLRCRFRAPLYARDTSEKL